MKIKPIKNLIHNIQEWKSFIKQKKDLTNIVVQDVDFLKQNTNWDDYILNNTSFLGCKLKKDEAINLIEKGAFIYPKFKKIPYNPYRSKLYQWQELMDGYSPNEDKSKDLEIYKHFVKNKYNISLSEALSQRIHDLSIDDALRSILQYDNNGMTQKKVIGFMGGHSTARNSEFYNKTALAAKRLAEKGYFVVSGGGPGIMEAANLGAYMAKYKDQDLLDAINILADLDINGKNEKEYTAKNYITNAQKILKIYPDVNENLAIPTWFYGHEPSNLFATYIAKYFSNSIREDMLLSISLYGLVYAPGSAGTTQEIFQEAAQNHYGTSGYYSPMVFLSKKRYVEDTAIYSVLHQLAKDQEYKKILYLTDRAEEVVDFIINNPPIPVLAKQIK